MKLINDLYLSNLLIFTQLNIHSVIWTLLFKFYFINTKKTKFSHKFHLYLLKRQ